MRHALIIAGGKGTRLWPMSTEAMPKQLIPFIHGRSLLQLAVDRLSGLIPTDRIYVCAGEAHRQVILDRIEGLAPDRFIGEPVGRDTLNAVGLGTGVIEQADPDATVAVFSADHIIEPIDQFQEVVDTGYRLAEQSADRLVTFGIEPSYPATGYGYLELGAALSGGEASEVSRFKEKPDADTARQYLDAGPEAYLWNSGMFVWQAKALRQRIERFAADNHAGIQQAIEAWASGETAKLGEIYPTLPKNSVDFAIMEPASQDARTDLVAVPMPVQWLDVGSWPAFAEAREKDGRGNVAEASRSLMQATTNSVVVSDDPAHLIATLGVDNLIIVHTDKATLVCHADHAQDLKDLHKQVAEQFGDAYI
jgi:mannose-1-phosphate guanylyltransferase